MATNPPPDFAPDQPEPEAAPDPWGALTQRGFDPTRYDPDSIVNGANLYTALRSRDYRDGALTDVLKNAGFGPDVDVRQLREMYQASQQQDPWEGLAPPQQEQPEYYDQPAQPAFDPRQLQGVFDAEFTRRFAEHDQRVAEKASQQAFEAEFSREVERVAKVHDFDQDEVVWLASQSHMLRESMPYASTGQLVDAAGKRIDNRLKQRLQALSLRQETEAPSDGLPPGPTPSDQQVPQDVAQARDAGRRFFNN